MRTLKESTILSEIKVILSKNKSNNKCKITREYLFKKEDGYNCWGFTAFMVGWTKKLYWMTANEMEENLETLSYHVDIPEIGDIAVFRSNNEILQHTAVLSKRKTVVHKTGSCSLERIDNVHEVIEYHNCYGSFSEYRRPL